MAKAASRASASSAELHSGSGATVSVTRSRRLAAAGGPLRIAAAPPTCGYALGGQLRGEGTAACNNASSFFFAAGDTYALTGESNTAWQSTIRFAPRRTADIHPWADAHCLTMHRLPLQSCCAKPGLHAGRFEGTSSGLLLLFCFPAQHGHARHPTTLVLGGIACRQT